MRLSILTVVGLRLFSIYWGVAGLVGIVAALGATQYIRLTGGYAALQFAIPFLAPTIYLLLALLTWRFAGVIGPTVVGKTDPELGFSEVTPVHLYTLGVFGFGLFYFLRHIAAMINWTHYLVINRAGSALLNEHDGLSLYEVTAEVIPCLAGAGVAIFAPKIAQRLASGGPKPNKAQ